MSALLLVLGKLEHLVAVRAFPRHTLYISGAYSLSISLYYLVYFWE